MSTRCQVQVVQTGASWEEKCTMYHHTDGYPSGILPLIQKAYELSGGGWESGRAGKVASFLCAADPGVFEPEEGHALHGDIEYYYRIHVVNSSNGSLAEKARWDITVYTSHAEGEFDELRFKSFWDEPTIDKMRLIIPRQPLDEAMLKYDLEALEREA